MASENICYLKAKGNFLMKPVSSAPPVWECLFPVDYSFKGSASTPQCLPTPPFYAQVGVVGSKLVPGLNRAQGELLGVLMSETLYSFFQLTQ